MKHQWDENKAMESAFDDLNEDEDSNSISSSPPSGPYSTCEICFDEILEVTDLMCKHKYCDECLDCYINMFINDSSGLLRNAVTCPGVNCSYEIDDDTVLYLLTDKPEMKSRYKRMIINAYVQSNVYMKWCPGSDCKNAIRIDEGVMQSHTSVRCVCKFWFCFTCLQPSHEPLSCDNYKLWTSVTSVEALSQNWILENSKKCPSCCADIQKNGGCMHMSCSNCCHEFCWICMEEWKYSDRGGHICNDQVIRKYLDTGAGDKQKASKSVEQLNHFNSHYQATLVTMNEEEKFFKGIRKMIPAEVELSDGYIKTDFIDNAFEILKLCRTAIMCSYGFSYYWHRKDNSYFLFEQKLTSLEKITTKLADKLTKVGLDNLKQIKVELTDIATVCLKSRKFVLEHFKECSECSDNEDDTLLLDLNIM